MPALDDVMSLVHLLADSQVNELIPSIIDESINLEVEVIHGRVGRLRSLPVNVTDYETLMSDYVYTKIKAEQLRTRICTSAGYTRYYELVRKYEEAREAARASLGAL
jgi:hypothetical protein